MGAGIWPLMAYVGRIELFRTPEEGEDVKPALPSLMSTDPIVRGAVVEKLIFPT